MPYSSGLPDLAVRSTTELPRANAHRKIITIKPIPAKAINGPKKYENELQAGT
jgi:hypothetical protein